MTELPGRILEGTGKTLSMAPAVVEKTFNKLGREASISFPETNYFLPTIYGLLGKRVENVDDLVRVLSILKGEAKNELTNETMLSNGVCTR